MKIMTLEELFADSRYGECLSENSLYLTPILAEYLDENSNFIKMAYLYSDMLGFNLPFYISLNKDYWLFIELTYDSKQLEKNSSFQEVVDFVEECMKRIADGWIEILIKEINDSAGKLKVYSKDDADVFMHYLKLSQCYDDELFHRGILVDKGEISYALGECTNYIIFTNFLYDVDSCDDEVFMLS